MEGMVGWGEPENGRGWPHGGLGGHFWVPKVAPVT